MIYLDNAATTFPKPEVVYAAMDKINRTAVNAGRGAYKAAYVMSQMISDTKQSLRKLIKAEINVPIVFSPSVTLALDQIINGIRFHEGENVYLSPYEHNAVARTIEKVREQYDLKLFQMPLTDTLEIDLEKLKYMFSKNRPSYIFCTHISNVTGYVLPVQDIFAEGKKYNSINILDSAQSLGLVEVDSRILNADIIAFAGHKTLYGPLGIGGFANISNLNLDVFITGGTGSDSLNLNMPNSPEGKYEAGSLNIVAIAGLQAALDSLDLWKNFEHEVEQTEYLIGQLSQIKGVNLKIPPKQKRVGIVSFTVDGYSSDDIGTILDEDFDISVRTGYHCAPFIHGYLEDEKCRGTVRVGVSQFTEKRELDALVMAIKEICQG